MKILLVGPSLKAVGGVATYCELALASLPDSPMYQIVGRRPDEKPGIRMLLRIPSDCLKYVQLLLNSPIDIIHFNPSLNFRSLIRDGLLLQLSRLSRAKKVVFLHGWDADTAHRLKNAVWRRVFRALFAPADCFIVLSMEFRRTLIELGIRVPTFVETVAVPDTAGCSARAVPVDHATKLLFLSRLERDKGVLDAIQIHRTLLDRGVNSQLCVAGDGPAKAEAEQMVRDIGLKNVEFTGHVSGLEKHAVLCAATVFLFPTKYGEGLPTCVLEAMIYGLPVITTSVGGIRDFFKDGEMGFLCDSFTITEFADVVQRLIDNPHLAAEISDRNMQYAKDNFRASRVTDRLTSIYQTLLRAP